MDESEVSLRGEAVCASESVSICGSVASTLSHARYRYEIYVQ